MKVKRLIAILASCAIATTAFVGCGSNEKDDKDTGKDDGKTVEDKTEDKDKDKEEEKVGFTYLNFKPEIAEKYDAIVKAYEEETGVKVKVQTAASGKYEETLKSEMAKKEAPTLFQINGPVGYETWKDYCADLKDTELYSHLLDKTLAVESDGGVYGIPYAVEGYGIIYNQAIMDKYFALSDKAVDVKSVDDINSFDTLKKVADDMQAKKGELGIEGVFASTSMSSGNAWRWETHLANLPFYQEFKDNTKSGNVVNTGLDAKTIDFKYNENFKNIFDLYCTDSCSEKGLLGSKTVDDAMAEFALGKCAMVQNGNWGWSQISGVDGNVVKESDIKFMPIYCGLPDEKNQGICVGTENYFAINAKASPEEQKSAEEFINWLYTSDKGKSFVVNDLGFIAPFDTFGENEKPSDPLSKEVSNWMSKDGVTTIPWIFQSFPSQAFKDTFDGALLEYVQGTQDWDYVVKTVQDTWASEVANK